MILTGATVVTSLDPVQVVRYDVHVADGRIAASSGGAHRDCSGCLVVPGNVCAHTHLYSALARGMPYALEPPANFTQILQRIWWRLDRALDEGSIRASALVGGMEALLSGTTTLVDHHASPNAIDGSLDIIEEALASLRVRSVLCYETSDRDGLAHAAAGVLENRRFLNRVRAEGPAARARNGRGPRLVHPLRRDARSLHRGGSRLRRRAPHPRRRGRGRRTRLARTLRPSRRRPPRSAPARSTSRRCSPTASTSTTTRSPSSTRPTPRSPTTRAPT